MLLIDDLHECEHLKRELKRHADKVSKYLVFHDTWSHGVNSRDIPGADGILPAIYDFLANNTDWRKVYDVTFNNGLIVLKR